MAVSEDLQAQFEAAVADIQRHRAAIVQAQHQVLRRELTMPEYNAVYKQHLDAIHALEARVAELQQRAAGEGTGAAGHY